VSSDALVETLNPSEPAEFDPSPIPSAKQGPLPRVFLMVNTLETGGSERQFVSLAHTLNRQRFSLSLGCIRRTGPFAASVGNIPEFRLGGSLYGRRSIAARLRLAWHLSQGKATIAHAFDFYTNLVLAPAARIAGVPIVIGSNRQLGDLLTRTQVMAQTAALRCCDRVICNSRAAAQALADCGIPRRRIVVIGNGLPAQAFAAAIPALPRRPGWLRVGMIERMNAAYKGHQLFLRAAARLSHAFPHLEFVLAGDGPLRGELQNLAEHLGIADRTIFLGDRRDIPEVLAALDATVLCSTSESLSNVILESMAAGVAVVATRVGGNPELLENGRGMLVPTGDEEALANGVLTIFRDHALRKSVAERARQFAAANYTQQVMTARHEQLYQ